MDELQCIPKQGEMNEVVFENVKFTVLEVEDRRIEKIKVEITPVEPEEDEDEDDDQIKNPAPKEILWCSF